MAKVVEWNNHKVSYTESPDGKQTDSSRNCAASLLLIEESQRTGAHFPSSTLNPGMPQTSKREKTDIVILSASVQCVTIPRNAS